VAAEHQPPARSEAFPVTKASACDHDFEEREEVTGDNLVPNGGELTYAWLECKHCGYQKDIEPEEFDYEG
jgi:C4-type Zn-finger protein